LSLSARVTPQAQAIAQADNGISAANAPEIRADLDSPLSVMLGECQAQESLTALTMFRLTVSSPLHMPATVCPVALLATSDGVTAAAADLRDPAAVMAGPELRSVIDPAKPAAVILGAVLHFLDADIARQVTAGYAQLIAPGSYLVISVACYDDEAPAKQLAAGYTAAPFLNHAPADILSFFAGLDMTGPGLAEAQTWRAWMPGPVLRRRRGHVLAGVARRA
jgi:hypothetical protein